MSPFECYKTYIAIKNHFTKDTYDYHKYLGKTRVTLQSFYKRKDRFWFEKLSRNKSDQEILNFFVSNFVSSENSQSLWIGDIIKNGELTYKNWENKIQSLSYRFKEEVLNNFSVKNFDEMFHFEENKHPKILKEYFKGSISIETLIIMDKILNYKNKFDKSINDPVWKITSHLINKYSPFLNINVFQYKKILKECIL
jgi:hypothetical protein